jgi:uncharacterized membrane protein YdbT with pleckstrin-like domain
MSYLRESLGDGETIIAEAHFPWIYSALAWAALIILGIIGIGMVIFVVMMVKRWTTEIGITSHRFVEKRGLIGRCTNEIALPNIEDVKVSQTALGRILDYGKVSIEGTGVDTVTTPNIADPVGFVRAIQTAKERART